MIWPKARGVGREKRTGDVIVKNVIFLDAVINDLFRVVVHN